MPDGKRKRRFSTNQARRRWYAVHRSVRFGRRFGWGEQARSASEGNGRFASGELSLAGAAGL